MGRLVAILTGEPVSPQTVSRLTRELDEAVRQFHQAPLKDQWAYLFLEGVSLRMLRPSGRQRVHMLVAYGVGGRRQPGNCWVTDGCPGLAAAIETVYPRALHQHCWVHLPPSLAVGVWLHGGTKGIPFPLITPVIYKTQH